MEWRRPPKQYRKLPPLIRGTNCEKYAVYKADLEWEREQRKLEEEAPNVQNPASDEEVCEKPKVQVKLANVARLGCTRLNGLARQQSNVRCRCRCEIIE